MMKWRVLLICGFLAMTTMLANAQESDCSTQMMTILEQVSDSCESIGRNEVCYGNSQIRSEVSREQFNSVGHIISIENLINLQTLPYMPDTDEWGIALFNIQANLESTLPGQLVTMVVFGDVEIQPDDDAPDEYDNPMQAFYMTTGIGQMLCNDVPTRGLLIQNPSGEEVELYINGFEVGVNSTALFSAEDREELTVTTLEGLITITKDDEMLSVFEGFTATVRQGDEFDEASPISGIQEESIPLDLLPLSVPQIGEPTTESIGLLQCAEQGGIDISAGSTIILRGGWAENTLSELLSFVNSYTPAVNYDGAILSHNYRTAPTTWQNNDQSGYLVNWYWEISNIAQGNHIANWLVAGETVSCEIRAN